MLKKFLPVLLAASLIAIALPVALAQSDAQSNAQSNGQSSDQMSGAGGRHHGPPDPAQRTAELTKKLNLTSDQQTKVQSIFESERSQMEALRNDSSLSQDDRHSKMMAIHQNGDSQVRALLDSNQQKKWDEMQAKRAQWQGRRGGSENPPPQQ
jgi:periplasmic protein CpxP/Spy